MTLRIHLEPKPVPEDIRVHPAVAGYLATLHDEEDENTARVGFLAPHDLLVRAADSFSGRVRLLAWLARGIDLHDKKVCNANQPVGRWLARELAQPVHLRPVITMRDVADVDELEWGWISSMPLIELKAMADADLLALDLAAGVNHDTEIASESVGRF